MGLGKRRCFGQAKRESERKEMFEHLLESNFENPNDKMMHFPILKSVFWY